MIDGTREIRRTALFASAREGWLEGVRALLRAGADPDAVSADIDRGKGGLWSASMPLPPRVTPVSCGHFWRLQQLLTP